MGLDIFFYRTSKSANLEEYNKKNEQLNKLYSLPQEEFKKPKNTKKADELHDWLNVNNPRVEIAYFCKVNFLIPFFDYGDNCSSIEIRKCQVEELVDNCNKVLDNHDLAEELLPTVCGFFFGSTDYDE